VRMEKETILIEIDPETEEASFTVNFVRKSKVIALLKHLLEMLESDEDPPGMNSIPVEDEIVPGDN